MRKKFFGLLIVAALMIGCEKKTMTVVSSAVGEDGFIADMYGYNDTERLDEAGMPVYSIPFEIKNAPEGTVSFALMMEDKDAFPVSQGFSWIHWTAANIKDTVIPAGAGSQDGDFVQGVKLVEFFGRVAAGGRGELLRRSGALRRKSSYLRTARLRSRLRSSPGKRLSDERAVSFYGRTYSGILYAQGQISAEPLNRGLSFILFNGGMPPLNLIFRFIVKINFILKISVIQSIRKSTERMVYEKIYFRMGDCCHLFYAGFCQQRF